jgi:alpha-methylacyl-CoA racemase
VTQGGQYPLSDIEVVVFAGLGPTAYASMILADLGCSVTIIDRKGDTRGSIPAHIDPRRRGQRTLAVDLGKNLGKVAAERLVSTADVVMEGMRPGAIERLGFGPKPCLELNEGLIYLRLTGWGQEGPYASMAGHDVNYIGLTGALWSIGSPDMAPVLPLNLLGDYAGGSTFAVIGILAALLERNRSGKGQVIDVAIVDGVLSLCTATIGMRNAGSWHERGEIPFDGSRPWYRLYETADGGYMAVGPIEAKFFETMLQHLGLDPSEWPRDSREQCDRLATHLEVTFKMRSRKQWSKIFDGTDACVTPVLSFDEAARHPHLAERKMLVDNDGRPEPAVVPRFSRTPGRKIGVGDTAEIGRDTDVILAELGFTGAEINQMHDEGTVQ